MSANASFCSRCGAELLPTSLFCPNCGQRVSDAAPLYPQTQKMPEAEPQSYAAQLPVDPSPAPYGGYADSYTPPAPAKRNPLWIIAGVLVGLCLCGTVIVGGTFALLGGPLAEAFAGTATPTATLAPTATHTSLPPTATPTQPPVEAALPVEPTAPVEQPTESVGAPVGAPKLADNPFYDDFSSDRGWPLVNTPEKPDYTVGWLGQVYSIVIKSPSIQAWVFPPTTYNPRDMEFDAQLPTTYNGQYGGTYGVLCGFIDGDNYHEIELDPFNKSFAIARIRANDRVPLTADNWLDFNAFNQGPGSVNHIQVSCEGSTIALYINNQLALSIDDPELASASDARMGLTVSTYGTIDPGGFEMWFDNFSAWTPQQ